MFVTSSQYPWSGHFYLRLNKSEHSTCGWTLGAPVGISLRGLGLGPEFRLRGPRRLAWELNPEVLAPIVGSSRRQDQGCPRHTPYVWPLFFHRACASHRSTAPMLKIRAQYVPCNLRQPPQALESTAEKRAGEALEIYTDRASEARTLL